MFEVCFKTDVGRKKKINEDSMLAKKLGDVYLLAVADGLGGHAAGEVASKLALVEIEEVLKVKLGKENIKEAMEDAVSKANSEIYLLSKENPAYANMGTTLVMAVVSNDKAVVANVGDSRAYLVENEIKQITTDHSLVQELLDKKLITEEEAFNHPQKNIVTKALGTWEEIKADFFEVDIENKLLLLCSDGLSDFLRDEEIREIVIASNDISETCDKLIDAAKEKGGDDNITVIIAKR